MSLFTRSQPVLPLWERRASHLFLLFASLPASSAVPSAIYSLCREELHPCTCIGSLPLSFFPFLRYPLASSRSSCTPEDTFNLSSPPLKSVQLFTDALGTWSGLDQRRAFRHLINPPTGARVRSTQVLVGITLSSLFSGTHSNCCSWN